MNMNDSTCVVLFGMVFRIKLCIYKNNDQRGAKEWQSIIKMSEISIEMKLECLFIQKSHFLFIFSLFRAWLILLHSTMNKNDIIIISSDEEEKELDSQQQTSQPCIWLILNYDLSIYLF